ncbi:MAG: exo-alpha-sialidase, partial [Candidatus Zixiibacteriota bacterium]
MEYFVNIKSIIDRSCSAVGFIMYKNGLLTIIGLLLFAGIAHAQQTADCRWLDDETRQPRNQYATIDNSPGPGGDWPVIDGWGPDMRLTYFDDPWAHNAEIAVYGDNIYVTWFRLFDDKMYFLRSTNGGGTWFENVQISDSSTYNAVMPQISAWGDYVYVVYRAWRPYEGIYLKRSTDRGATWQDTQRLYYTARNYGSMPVITSGGQHVFCIFAVITEWDPFVSKLFLARSTDYGESWSDTIYVSDLTYSGLGPDLSMNIPGLHLIRGKNLLSSSTTEILYNRSTDEGDDWAGPDTLSYNDTSGSFWPQIASWGDSNVIVSWTDYKYSPYAWTGDAFICRSTDNGETWSEPVQMTDLHLVKATDISADADTVFLAYSDYRYGDREIIGNISYDG